MTYAITICQIPYLKGVKNLDLETKDEEQLRKIAHQLCVL